MTAIPVDHPKQLRLPPVPLPSRLATLCVLILAATPAFAADFDRPYPPQGFGHEGRDPPPRSEPEFRGPPRFTTGPRFEHGPGSEPPEACRTFVRRRLDADGEPVLRRVRVCDEPSFERGPPPPLPLDDISPRRWGGPRW